MRAVILILLSLKVHFYQETRNWNPNLTFFLQLISLKFFLFILKFHRNTFKTIDLHYRFKKFESIWKDFYNKNTEILKKKLHSTWKSNKKDKHGKNIRKNFFKIWKLRKFINEELLLLYPLLGHSFDIIRSFFLLFSYFIGRF